MNQPPLPTALQDGCPDSRPDFRPDSCPDWCYWVWADHIPLSGQWITLSPTKAQRSAVAARMGVEDVETLDARLHLIPHRGGHVMEVAGELRAQLIQICVRTLQPIRTEVHEDITAWFADYDQAASFKRAHIKAQQTNSRPLGQDMECVASEQDDPEPMTHGQIDLADLVQQFLSLGLNPYPVAADDAAEATPAHIPAHLDNTRAPEPLDTRDLSGLSGPHRPQNPFHMLKNWRPKD